MGCGSSTKVVPVNETATNNHVKSQSNEDSKRGNLKQVKSSKKVEKPEKEFPDPEDVEILEHTPIKEDNSLYLKIEDTFWEEKRKLIPDYSVMLKLDQHALKVFF